MAQPPRPIRTLTVNVDEGDDLDRLRSAFDLGSDALFYDLEDHVPRPKLPLARENIRTILDERGDEKPIFVRVNRCYRSELLDDLEAVVSPGLFGVILPKVADPAEVAFLDRCLELFENRAGLEVGRILILPLLETAKSLRNAYKVAKASKRVEYLGGMVNQHGDPARSIRYEWTRSMEESLYIRQKVLLDARAAGVRYPMCGVWNPAADLEGLEAFAVRCRQIGYFGLQIMPIPEHVELVNRVFTPTQEEIDYWADIIEMMEEVAADELMPDLVVEGQIIPANRGDWAKLRLAHGAEFGIVPNPDRVKRKADHAGRASEHWRDLARRGR